MKIRHLHSWDLTAKEAVALQRELAGQVDTGTPLPPIELIAGADISYSRFSNILYAGVVVLRMTDMSVVERQGIRKEVGFPYISGLLSFRETPVLLEAFARVESEPDAVMVDGQGYAHPRRMGYACHLGLWLDRPCLGCAKSRLLGTYQEPGREAGSRSPLIDRGEVIGDVVRTKTGIKPVYVSVGHKIDLASAVNLALTTGRGYRIPEPTRQAHLHVNQLRRDGACEDV